MNDDGASCCSLFAFSPVPTVLIAVGEHASGVLAAVSCSAQALFAPCESDLVGLPASELVDQASTSEWCAAISQLVDEHTNDAMLLEITSAVETPASGLVAHLRLLPSGDILAQFTPASDHQLAKKMLAEQKRFRAALLELGDLAHRTEDDDDFFQRLLERTVSVVPGARAGSILLAIPNSTEFRFVAAVGYDLERLQEHNLDKKYFFRDTQSPDAKIVKDLNAVTRTAEISEWLETVGRISEIKSNVSAPVLVDGLPVAFLSLDNFVAVDAMNETSVEMMTVFARLIGELHVRRGLESAIRDEREAFRHLALHDPLTGLVNRRSFEHSLDKAITATARRGRPLAVLFTDLDDFKHVNDTRGHAFGDRVLAAIALRIDEAVRTGDIVGRWGGDEFVVLPTRLDSAEEAIEVGERILAFFEEPLDIGDGQTYRAQLTIGIGWSLDNLNVRPKQFLRAADEALYEAKAAGKGTLRLHKV